MKNLVIAAALALSVAPSAAQRPDDMPSLQQLRQELIEVETNIVSFGRLIPNSFDVADQKKELEQMAQEAELAPIEIRLLPGPERLSLDDGRPLPLEIHRLEIEGSGPYPAVHFFLSIIRYRFRGIESLRLDAGKGETVRFLVRLIRPTWVPALPEDGPASDAVAAARRRLATNRAVLDRIVATVKLVRDDRGLDALSLFTRAVEEQPVVLTSVRIDDALTMEGLVRGAAARAAVTSGLNEAKLRASRLDWSPAGACAAFSVTARPDPPAETNDLEEIAVPDFTPGRSVFDGESAALCRGEPASPARRIVVRGDAATDADAFFLRLRDTHLVDVFFVLNDLISEDFIVDEEVKGRVDLDILTGAAIDDALRALATEGVVIGAPPLRRVSRGKPAAAAAPSSASLSEPITLSFRNADLSGILCVLGEVSEREIRMPRDLRRRVSLYADEVPIGAVLDQLVPAPGPSAVNACEVSATIPGSRLSPNRLQLHQIGIADLRVAGFAQFGENRKVYVYGPAERIMTLEPGARLFDGSVRSIGPEGVAFDSDKGTVNVPFVP